MKSEWVKEVATQETNGRHWQQRHGRQNMEQNGDPNTTENAE